MVSSAKWKRNYQYDSLGRLTLAQTTGPQWGQSFSYDGFGNLTAEVATKGTAPTVYNNYDPATNRLLGSGYTYDANGNLTAMPGLSMTYNVENRLTQAISNLNGTDNYGYDPAGHRVWKQGPDGVTHVYYNGLDGKPLADFSLNPQTQQVQGGSPMLYFAGKRVDNAAVEDRLGTAVVENGQQRMAFFPYGSQRSGTSSQVQYATYTRDATTTLDYAQQRYYSSQIGRYTTPDPKRSSAQAANPQSWNRYSYALGDPVNKTDPSGADPEFEDGEEMSPFGGMSSFGDAPTYLTMISVPEISIGIAVPGDSDDSDDPGDYGGDPCYDASADIFSSFGSMFGLLGNPSTLGDPSCGSSQAPPKPPPCDDILASEINEVLLGTPLAGDADMFVGIGKDDDIDPRLFAAIAFGESNLGTSHAATAYNNPFGLMHGVMLGVGRRRHKAYVPGPSGIVVGGVR
jgi:RHS repeat-associated protein